MIAAQNEEAMIALCIRSFLEFGDELIIVDNGSTDHTKEIAAAFAARYPGKVRFFDVPDLPDLFHNRQYAYEQSKYHWVVRADADFVAYTQGDYNIAELREYLLRHNGYWPPAIAVDLPNVSVDFWHTGAAHDSQSQGDAATRRYIPPAMTGHRPRIYRPLPGFRFQRCGRWEGVRFKRFYDMTALRWPRPVWMHCNLKPDMHHFIRSERTNWRQHGDFKTFPTLKSYVEHVAPSAYGTDDWEKAAEMYMQQRVYPYLEKYDPVKYHPYPSAVEDQMKRNPMYRVVSRSGQFHRETYPLDAVEVMLGT